MKVVYQRSSATAASTSATASATAASASATAAAAFIAFTDTPFVLISF